MNSLVATIADFSGKYFVIKSSSGFYIKKLVGNNVDILTPDIEDAIKFIRADLFLKLNILTLNNLSKAGYKIESYS